MDISVLYEDRHLLLCVKPAGVLSAPDPHGGEAMPSLLRNGDPSRESLQPITRLDRPVAGVMLLAKNGRAAAALSELLHREDFCKEYFAVATGAVSEKQGRMEDLLYHDPRRNKTFCVDRVRRGVKDASLAFTWLESREEYHLFSVRLHTGRTHQIRVQFASRGLPLVGDGKYGSKANAPAIALYAKHLAFSHPFTGKPVEGEAPLPSGGVWDVFFGK